MKCRHCDSDLKLPFINLGSAPPSNAFPTEAALREPEKWYPLRVLVCTECWLVQTEDYADSSELFSREYAYFSSFSTTWLKHAELYVAAMAKRFLLGKESQVVEVASNDGYLLQYVHARGIPCFGIEPTASTARAARAKGIEVIEEFFGIELAQKLLKNGRHADLIVANNVLAHVPDINDFVVGLALLLKPQGVVTIEFPSILNLVNERQFDTIYHEHFSYLSLTSVRRILEQNGLKAFDVDELPTHGGSLRVYAQRKDTGKKESSRRLEELSLAELNAGLETSHFYASFQAKADRVKNDFLSLLLEARKCGKSVVAYGAAAKGNTLMNYAGVRQDLIQYVVDRNPAKQHMYTPGSRIPIVDEAKLLFSQPDYVVVLPWNLKEEVTQQLNYIRKWGGKFVTAIPEVEVV